MPRLILAVVTGYLVFAISAALWFQTAGQDPHATPTILFGIASVLYGIVCAIAAGYVAAQISRRSKLTASIAVGCVIATGAAVSLVLEGPHESMWSQVAALLLMAPAAYLGGIAYLKKNHA